MESNYLIMTSPIMIKYVVRNTVYSVGLPVNCYYETFRAK